MNKQIKKPILIGLSGSLDSFVAAYLLKIQKESLFGITFITTSSSLYGCQISEEQIKSIKVFCDRLQIPHQIMSLESEFFEEVQNPFIASRIEGRARLPCYNCHKLKINQLYQQMKLLKLERFATGHLAKVVKSIIDDSVSVFSSPDTKNDQSSYFMSLHPAILKAIELPLSDLQKSDILKLAENFSLKSDNNKHCLESETELNRILTKEIPESLINEGDLIDQNERKLGSHKGIHLLSLGRTWSRDPHAEEQYKIHSLDYRSGLAYLSNDEGSSIDGALVSLAKYSVKQGLSRPFKGYAKFSKDRSIEVIVYPKTLNSAYIKFNENAVWIYEGEVVSVFKQRNRSSTLLFQGSINKILKINQKTDALDEEIVIEKKPLESF